MRGDPDILTREYMKDFCLARAMDAAGYKGRGRIYEAARDIEERADFLRRQLDPRTDEEVRLDRILAEYERIAFSVDDENIRIADKLKALEMYRILSSGDGGTGGGTAIVVNYDYGD